MQSPIFEIKNVTKSYLQADALKDVSLTVEKNDIFGIIGMSGAGKSTLIRLLARLVIPSRGEVIFHGEKINEIEGKELRDYRKKIGMIFQHFNLLSSRTVADNIAYPLEISSIYKEERVDELLKLVGLEHKKHVYPSALSGGEKQRVAIARALATEPEVLLSDEATSALDPQTTREILDLLKSLHKRLGITIVLITHEMDVVKQICNKVAVIEKGKIVEEGLVTEVFSNPQHITTKNFLRTSSHSIPDDFFKEISPNRKLLRLTFRGKPTNQPIISDIVRSFDVNANILLGWIDRLQDLVLGTLIIELTGHPESIEKSLHYFKEHDINFEVLKHGP